MNSVYTDVFAKEFAYDAIGSFEQEYLSEL